MLLKWILSVLIGLWKDRRLDSIILIFESLTKKIIHFY